VDKRGKSCKLLGKSASSVACGQFRSIAEDAEKLTKALRVTRKPQFFGWLDDLTYSEAFFVCVGAGPWKYQRREKVQNMALTWLGDRDISELTEYVDAYPLSWENKMATAMASNLRKAGLSFDEFCAEIKDKAVKSPSRTLFKFYKAAGTPHGAKVLSLFCRDKLNIECFPVDRWVRRWLVRHGLPTDESGMVQVCRHAGVDTKYAATAAVQTGLDVGFGPPKGDNGNPIHKTAAKASRKKV
jgi:hypothetical protein